MKIDFTMTDGKYSFSDALHLDDDHDLSDAEIEAMKQARFDNWVAIITALPPPTIEEQTKLDEVASDDLEAAKTDVVELEAALDDANARVAALENGG